MIMTIEYLKNLDQSY